MTPAPDRFAVARALREIGRRLEVEGGNPFRARAWERGARAVEALSEGLDILIAEKRLTHARGIGANIAATIEELVGTGRSALLERLRERLPPGVLELHKVLTLPRIRALHEALGLDSLADLEAACRAGRVRAVKGFGERTEQKILADIEELARRRPETLLHEAMAEAEGMLAFVRAHPAVEQADVAGALRRRAETITRYDLVAASHHPEAILDHLARFPLAESLLRRDADRVLLRLSTGLTLQAVVASPGSYPAALHRLTGSDTHLSKLEAVAATRGLSMDPTGLRRADRRLTVRSEADVYRHLRLAYIAPELREDQGEVEAAAAGTLPSDLVTLADIQGMVHCHTHFSDGTHSVEEMARGAEALGLHYVTITDHSPTASYARGLTLDRLRRQWDDIARVQEMVKVRILRGTESDILLDGSLDYPDAILDQLDIVIASVHNRHRLDATQMTRRIVRAVRHPCFKIWGHALGRYVLRRPPFACHMEEILDAVAKARAAIEVNGDPHRLDLEPRWIREARSRGIKFVISSDAHSVDGLRNVRWGVDMARRGWLSSRDVLNTLGPEAFRAAVKP